MVKSSVLVLILIHGTVYGSLAQEPSWILLERGKVAYESQELSSALDFFVAAVDMEDNFPEGEFWLGQVYVAQGQKVLAEEQYRLALDLSIYLRVPDEKYLFSYALAELLMDSGKNRRREAENILSEITETEGASSASKIALEHLYIENFVSKGLDELLYLYRDELMQSLRAHQTLGEIAWEEARYRTALRHSVRTVLSLLSTAIQQFIDYDANWRFDIDPIGDEMFPDRDVRYPYDNDGISDLLIRLENETPQVLEWLENSGFWPQLYLLSVSLYAEGYWERASSLWNLLAPSDSITGINIPMKKAGIWGNLAAQQLQEPFISTGSLEP